MVRSPPRPRNSEARGGCSRAAPARRRATAPASIAFALLIAAICAGCAPAGSPYECECDFLTDFDDASKVSVRVCAANDREAPSVGRGCAQLAAPAPVQSCVCKAAAPEPKPCREGCRD